MGPEILLPLVGRVGVDDDTPTTSAATVPTRDQFATGRTLFLPGVHLGAVAAVWHSNWAAVAVCLSLHGVFGGLGDLRRLPPPAHPSVVQVPARLGIHASSAWLLRRQTHSLGSPASPAPPVCRPTRRPAQRKSGLLVESHALAPLGTLQRVDGETPEALRARSAPRPVLPPSEPFLCLAVRCAGGSAFPGRRLALCCVGHVCSAGVLLSLDLACELCQPSVWVQEFPCPGRDGELLGGSARGVRARAGTTITTRFLPHFAVG